MSEGIPAIFDNGVFRPVGQVDLPDQTAVTVFPAVAAKQAGDGIRASAGAWADAGDDFDEWLAELRRWRDMERGNPMIGLLANEIAMADAIAESAMSARESRSSGLQFFQD